MFLLVVQFLAVVADFGLLCCNKTHFCVPSTNCQFLNDSSKSTQHVQPTQYTS